MCGGAVAGLQRHLHRFSILKIERLDTIMAIPLYLVLLLLISYKDASGERRYRTLISLLGSLATMRRVVNYHSSWARQRQVEFFDASGIRLLYHDSIGYPRMSASGESSTTMHRLLHASGSHPIPTPYDPKNEIRCGWYQQMTPKSDARAGLNRSKNILRR
ncbi:hypothetical protein F511_20966 [Dorcoceras hygrometricum]|uniref:Uncharacterized protein n=1 Tax=Dorcoceras hygrometricum TaxID=472368 RepID=A0A2Z7BR02_9LAMI|nr:hypothetical protein F511_20966 [Dorcoceras hygrometricum]